MKFDQMQAIYRAATADELDFINFVECGEPVSQEDAEEYDALIKKLYQRSQGDNQ